MMGAFGSAAAAVFGVFWTIMAVNMGAPIFFALFGVIFVVMGIVQAVYNYKNATGKERFSSFDITDDSEEPDPLNEYFGKKQMEHAGPRVHRNGAEDNRDGDTDIDTDAADAGVDAFCPYCGAETEKEYLYCTKCGKKLP
jgi:hypothetical protein